VHLDKIHSRKSSAKLPLKCGTWEKEMLLKRVEVEHKLKQPFGTVSIAGEKCRLYISAKIK